MRFLQLCADTGIAPGSTKGAAQHLRGVASGLLALGHQVETVSARPAEGPFPAPVIPIRYLDDDPVVGPVDVIYERYSLGHRAGLELARRLGRPFVLEVNAPLVDEARIHRPGTLSPGAAMEEAVEAELLAEADLVIAVSRSLQAWAERHRVGPTVTIGNGFEPTWFPPRTGEVTNPDPGRKLVFIGHPKPWHGADRLPRLLADLADRGLDLSLLVIGGGSGAEVIRRESERLGVADRVEVTGPLAPWEATRLLAEGLIGLAPYRRIDPFYFCPLKIVDYLAAGLPVVSTAQGDVPDLVGAAGLVVDPDDEEALAGAVATLVRDPHRRRLMAAAGWRRAHTELTWNRVAARTVDAIESIDTTNTTDTATTPAESVAVR